MVDYVAGIPNFSNFADFLKMLENQTHLLRFSFASCPWSHLLMRTDEHVLQLHSIYKWYELVFIYLGEMGSQVQVPRFHHASVLIFGLNMVLWAIKQKRWQELWGIQPTASARDFFPSFSWPKHYWVKQELFTKRDNMQWVEFWTKKTTFSMEN